MKKIISLVLVAVLVLGVTSFVWAYGGNNRPGRNNRRGSYQQESYREKLNLSTEQEERIEELEDKYEDQLDKVRDQLRDKQEELQELYSDKKAGKEEIISLHGQVSQLRNQLAKMRVEYQLDVRDVLSSEQLEECKGQNFGFRMGIRGFAGHRGRRGR